MSANQASGMQVGSIVFGTMHSSYIVKPAANKTHLAEANRLIDEMLTAQTQFAHAWRDDAPLTIHQFDAEQRRDRARAALLKLLSNE